MPVALINRRDPKVPGGRFDLNIDDLENLASIIQTAVPDQAIRWNAKNVHRKEFAMSGAADIAELRQPVKMVEIIAGYRFSITMSRNYFGVMCNYDGWGSMGEDAKHLLGRAVNDFLIPHRHRFWWFWRWWTGIVGIGVPVFVWSLVLAAAPNHGAIADIGGWPLLVLFIIFAYWVVFFCGRTSGVGFKPVRRGDPPARSRELVVGILGVVIGLLGLIAAVVVPLAHG
jgi:hypothetical protein